MAKTLKEVLESFDFNRAALAKQRLQNLRHQGRKVRGARIANLMRAAGLREEEMDETDLDQLDEVLSADAKAEDWIHDFVHSTAPQFQGKTKKERIKMALGAYYHKVRHKDGEGLSEAYQSYSGRSHGHAYGGGGFGRREREDDEYHVPDPVSHAPVAPVPAKKYIKGTPEHKAAKAASKPINGHPTNEEVEQIDEISLQTMKSAKEKLGQKAYDAHMDDNKYAARHYAGRALKMGSRIKKKEQTLSTVQEGLGSVISSAFQKLKSKISPSTKPTSTPAPATSNAPAPVAKRGVANPRNTGDDAY